MSKPLFFLRLMLSSLVLCALPSPAFAQTALEDFFKNPRIGTATLSPNGKYLATTANIKGMLQLAVVEMDTGAAKTIAGYEKLDVVHIHWINDERIVFSVIDRDGEQTSSSGGLYAIDRDGGKSSILIRSLEHALFQNQAAFLTSPLWMRMLDVARDDPNSIIALGYFFNRDVVPYRVDTLTERRKEIYFNVPGLARDFIFDGRNQLRVVVSANAEDSIRTVWYRDTVDQAWRKLSEHSSMEPRFSVIGFDEDNQTMIVAAPAGDGRKGIYKYDFANNKPGELLASDKNADVDGGLVFSPDTRKLLGVRMTTEPPRTQWLDKGYAALQAGIDRAYPNLVNVIHPGNAGAAMLVYSYSSTHPGNYSIYDPAKKKLRNLFATRPWLDPKKMSEQLVFDYVARDGLPIPSYLTLPQGREAKALPLVVLPHGGPWARDHWGFDPQVQFLAGLGYAVLQPQFRGSTGFGDNHFKKGFKQWGLAMQDDITDGVNSLIKQGLADPKRICIMGASYGGYAVLMGLIKDTYMYKCGINLLGVTDLAHLYSNVSGGDDRVAQYGKKEMIGDPDTLREQFIATSPSRQAGKILAPVFMVYGEKDRRVPLIHGEDMRDALRKQGKAVEWMELEKEEHGFAKEENRFKVYGAIETFLKKYNSAK